MCLHIMVCSPPTRVHAPASLRSNVWQAKQGALLLLGALTRAVPAGVAEHLVDIVPAGTHGMLDARAEVRGL